MGSYFEMFIQKEIIQKSKLDNIKSIYILKQLIKYISKKKLLRLVKMNKWNQKKLNLDINSYKIYSETYSTIKIEIIPTKSKAGKFMKNLNKEEEKYYHIYFNDTKKEIKRNVLKKDDNVSIIQIVIDHQVKSFEDLFSNGKCIEFLYVKKCYRKNINNMSGMFFNCTSLKKIDIHKLKTHNVTNMSYMFDNCSSLKELNLENFKTNKVTDMSLMFYGCSSLEKINLSSFNTENVTDMSYMFEICRSLKKLNIANFKTNKLIKIERMFSQCPLLKEIKFEKFNKNNIEDIRKNYNIYF